MKKLSAIVLVLVLSACSSLELSTSMPLPDKSKRITIFALENYTDTPQAGKRASNLIEGVLLSQEFILVNAVALKTKSLSEKLRIASENGSDYMLTGGVSEWRYKTGIDGEPAISLQCKIIDVESANVVWSKTASSNDWGNASIGTTAQAMMTAMFAQE